MNLLRDRPREIGARFIGVRHSGERVELHVTGEELSFCAGTETTDLCDSWVMKTELQGWEPLPATAKLSGISEMSENLAGFRGGRGWYFCWLIEMRGKEHPVWVTPARGWTDKAHGAMWFARKSDAEAVAAEFSGNVIVCEHGFDLAAPAQDAFPTAK